MSEVVWAHSGLSFSVVPFPPGYEGAGDGLQMQK
jgi:hypothetical protein